MILHAMTLPHCIAVSVITFAAILRGTVGQGLRADFFPNNDSPAESLPNTRSVIEPLKNLQQWNAWSPCSCGGVQHRTARLPQPNGESSGVAPYEIQPCKPDPEANCGKRDLFSNSKDDADNRGSHNPEKLDRSARQGVIGLGNSQRHGGYWGPWSGWSSCGAYCTGNQERYRECYDQLGCIGAVYEVRQCQGCFGNNAVIQPTPYTNYNQLGYTWTTWSSCSVTCGQGIKSRYRTCRPQDGCRGRVSEKSPCYSRSCGSLGVVNQPIWGSWGNWGACSVTCGYGTQIRSQQCIYSPGSGCGYPPSESRTCQLRTCFGNSLGVLSGNDFSSCSFWSVWSACSVACGYGGSRTRQRTCRNQYGGSNVDVRTDTCYNQNCGVIGGNLIGNAYRSNWGHWGACSVSCGEGIRSRTRTCNPQYERCRSVNQAESQQCLNTPCIYGSGLGLGVLGGFQNTGQWSLWSQCNAGCGLSGSQTRNRQCYAGSYCYGLNTYESRSCRGLCGVNSGGFQQIYPYKEKAKKTVKVQ